jgi:hypothetical protein
MNKISTATRTMVLPPVNQARRLAPRELVMCSDFSSTSGVRSRLFEAAVDDGADAEARALSAGAEPGMVSNQSDSEFLVDDVAEGETLATVEAAGAVRVDARAAAGALD